MIIVWLLYSDDEMLNAKFAFKYNTPMTKEAYWYRQIFHELFPGRSAEETVKVLLLFKLVIQIILYVLQRLFHNPFCAILSVGSWWPVNRVFDISRHALGFIIQVRYCDCHRICFELQLFLEPMPINPVVQLLAFTNQVGGKRYSFSESLSCLSHF